MTKSKNQRCQTILEWKTRVQKQEWQDSTMLNIYISEKKKKKDSTMLKLEKVISNNTKRIHVKWP